MEIKKINEFLAEGNLPIKFVEWAADYLFEPMYYRIGFETWISRFDGEKCWSYGSNKLKRQGIDKLHDIDIWTKFCEENEIELKRKDRTAIIFKESFDPIDFFKFICEMNLVKYNWTFNGIKQPFYWTNLKKGKGRYSTEELYEMFKNKK